MARQRKAKPSQTQRTPQQEIAQYAGMLARWCELTGNAPPPNADIIEYRKEAFRAHLKQLAAETKGNKNDNTVSSTESE